MLYVWCFIQKKLYIYANIYTWCIHIFSLTDLSIVHTDVEVSSSEWLRSHLQIFDPWLPWIFRSSHGSMGSTGPFLRKTKLDSKKTGFSVVLESLENNLNPLLRYGKGDRPKLSLFLAAPLLQKTKPELAWMSTNQKTLQYGEPGSYTQNVTTNIHEILFP